jgi:hypothetical protein
MIHLLLFKDGGGENNALAALFDSGAQKETAQVLLYGPGAYLEFFGNLLVTAALH